MRILNDSRRYVVNLSNAGANQTYTADLGSNVLTGPVSLIEDPAHSVVSGTNNFIITTGITVPAGWANSVGATSPAYDLGYRPVVGSPLPNVFLIEKP